MFCVCGSSHWVARLLIRPTSFKANPHSSDTALLASAAISSCASAFAIMQQQPEPDSGPPIHSSSAFRNAADAAFSEHADKSMTESAAAGSALTADADAAATAAADSAVTAASATAADAAPNAAAIAPTDGGTASANASDDESASAVSGSEGSASDLDDKQSAAVINGGAPTAAATAAPTAAAATAPTAATEAAPTAAADGGTASADASDDESGSEGSASESDGEDGVCFCGEAARAPPDLLCSRRNMSPQGCCVTHVKCLKLPCDSLSDLRGYIEGETAFICHSCLHSGNPIRRDNTELLTATPNGQFFNWSFDREQEPFAAAAGGSDVPAGAAGGATGSSTDAGTPAAASSAGDGAAAPPTANSSSSAAAGTGSSTDKAAPAAATSAGGKAAAAPLADSNSSAAAGTGGGALPTPAAAASSSSSTSTDGITLESLGALIDHVWQLSDHLIPPGEAAFDPLFPGSLVSEWSPEHMRFKFPLSLVWAYDAGNHAARNSNQSIATWQKDMPLLPFYTLGVSGDGNCLFQSELISNPTAEPSEQSAIQVGGKSVYSPYADDVNAVVTAHRDPVFGQVLPQSQLAVNQAMFNHRARSVSHSSRSQLIIGVLLATCADI